MSSVWFAKFLTGRVQKRQEPKPDAGTAHREIGPQHLRRRSWRQTHACSQSVGTIERSNTGLQYT